MTNTRFCAFDSLNKYMPSLPDMSAVTGRGSKVGNILTGAVKENVAISKDWASETGEMLKDTFKVRKDPTHYAFAASDLVMESATKTPAYLTKYAQLAWDTNVSLWGAVFGKAAVADVTEEVTETAADAVETVAKATKAGAENVAEAATDVAETAETVAVKADIVDDIELIDGIGPVIAKKLREHGITSLLQIAALTDAQIETIEDELAFKGRIGRDNWVEQANALLAK